MNPTMTKFSESIMRVLRQRMFEIDPHDTSMDSEINQLTPAEAFVEFADFKLGGGWGDVIAYEWPELFGLELKPVEC